MRKKIILFIGLFFWIASVGIASDKPTKLIPTDGNMHPVAVQYIQNDDGTYSKIDSGTALPVSGSFSLIGTADIGDISKGTQTNDVKVTLDGEEVAETNSLDIKTALEVIDNFISGSRGLVTEDNSADIKTAIEAINTAVQSGGITQTQLEAIKTALETIDNAISGSEMQVDVVAPLPVGTNEIGGVTANAGTNLNTSALLTETTWIGRLGEVQATPTANTLLSRLKVIADNQLADGHNVTVDNISLAVTGTFWQATQPVSGTVTANAGTGTMAVDLGANNDVTVTSGAITETNSGTIAGDTTSIDGKITSCNTGAVVISSALPSGTNKIGSTSTAMTLVRKESSQDLSVAALSYTTNFAAKTRVKSILLHASGNITETITFTFDSKTGVNYDTTLLSEALSAEANVSYFSDNDLILESGDEILIACTNTGGANSVYVTVLGETIQ